MAVGPENGRHSEQGRDTAVNLVCVHGGVSGREREEVPSLERSRRAGLGAATALDAVEAAVCNLEDNPVLNAGLGSVLLFGEAATQVAEGVERLERSTPEQHERWARAEASGELRLDRYGDSEHVDTVGAVVVDGAGRFAAGSSTGGVFGQMPGRIGDSPIFGAGIYASAEVAVVGTGVGELFLETLACFRAGELVEGGLDPQGACERVIGYLGGV